MKGKTSRRLISRRNRQRRIRSRITGTGERPRLCVFRSNKHIYAQVIDDMEGKTLASASTICEAVKNSQEELSGKEAARLTGKVVAERCKEKGVESVVFERNGFIYKKDGRIGMLAKGAREGGLKF